MQTLGIIIGSAVVLAFWIVLLVGGRRRSVDEPRPGFVEVPPQPGGGGAFGQQMRAITEASNQVVWGSPSIKTWERRCAESLNRSRARRARSTHR
jgi:hypothetical protein